LQARLRLTEHPSRPPSCQQARRRMPSPRLPAACQAAAICADHI
jgi:hypothetical protein